MRTLDPYKPSIGYDNKHFVSGPGDGTGYYAGTLYPEMRLSDEANAKAAAEIANTAYRAGYEAAQSDIRRALGVKG